jgi:tight adherence protein C
MLATPLVIGCAVFVCVGACMAMLHVVFFAERSSIEGRLADIALKMRTTNGVLQDPESQSDHGLGRMLVQWAVRRLPPSKVNNPRSEKLRQTLSHAGFHSLGALRAFQVLQFAAIGACGLGGLIVSFVVGAPLTGNVLYTIAGVIAGKTLPVFYVGRRATRRQSTIRKELSDILDLLVVCLESGLGVYQAIRIVGREAQQQGRELGNELSILSGEITAGSSLGQALRAMAERTGVDDARSLAAILIQSEKLGSQMAPALRASSDTLRTKRRLRAEEAAQKSTIKMLIPLVLFVLPAMMAVILGPAVVQVFHNFRH